MKDTEATRAERFSRKGKNKNNNMKQPAFGSLPTFHVFRNKPVSTLRENSLNIWHFWEAVCLFVCLLGGGGWSGSTQIHFKPNFWYPKSKSVVKRVNCRCAAEQQVWRSRLGGSPVWLWPVWKMISATGEICQWEKNNFWKQNNKKWWILSETFI